MVVCYALEHRSRWFVLAFAGACARLGLWLSAGRVAVRPGGGDLGPRRGAALVTANRPKRVSRSMVTIDVILFELGDVLEEGVVEGERDRVLSV